MCFFWGLTGKIFFFRVGHLSYTRCHRSVTWSQESCLVVTAFWSSCSKYHTYYFFENTLPELWCASGIKREKLKYLGPVWGKKQQKAWILESRWEDVSPAFHCYRCLRSVVQYPLFFLMLCLMVKVHWTFPFDWIVSGSFMHKEIS